MHSKSLITCLIFGFAVLFTPELCSQKTLLLPLEIKFYDAGKRKKPKKFLSAAKTVDELRMTAIMNNQTVPDIEEGLQEVLGEILSEYMEQQSGSYELMVLEDLSPRLRKMFDATKMYLQTARASKGMLIGKKQFESEQSARLAPLINELCDEFAVDNVMLVSVIAFNYSERFSQKGAPPVGDISVTGKVFDGDSGLVIKQKSKQRPSGVTGGERGIKITTKAVSGAFRALLKAVL